MRGAAHVSADARGAIFVEKLIAYAPLMVLFFLGFQLAELAAAQLVVARATSAAARAAMVVLPDDPVFYQGEEAHRFDGARKDDVYLAAAMVLSAAPQIEGTFEVQVSEPPVAEFGPLDVTVHATYRCGGVTLLCDLDKTIAFRSTTTVAYHRAQYAYEVLPDVGSVVLGGRSEALGNQNRAPAAGNPGTGANTTGGSGSGPSESSPPAQGGQTCKCPPWSQRINTGYSNAFSGWDWKENGIRGELRQGVVGFSIRKGPCTPSGDVMFNRMMDHFRSAETILGKWSTSCT